MFADRGESVWARVLAQAASKAALPVGSVYVLGNPDSGKKTLLAALRRVTHQLTESHLQAEGLLPPEPRKRPDQAYVVDYRYLRVPREGAEDAEELGRLNCYLFNEKYPLFRLFVDAEALRNFLVVLVFDLERPEAIGESFVQWMNFVNDNLVEFVAQSLPGAAASVRQRLEDFLARNARLAGGEGGAPAEQPEAGLGFPLLFLATKCDALDAARDPRRAEFAQYTLRSLALKHGAALMYVSARREVNLQLLVDYLGHLLLGKEEARLPCCLSDQALFVPALYDRDQALLDAQFGAAGECDFPAEPPAGGPEPAEEEPSPAYEDFLAKLQAEQRAPAAQRVSDKIQDMLPRGEIPPTQKRSLLVRKLLDGLDKSRLSSNA